MNTLIPTNIITGFLGVGKTTAIKHLLSNKPEHEVWSVLVNEFGEIGIDGALIKEINAHVREVPGGCICCVGGLPMKIALNMMIATTKPDRILIEPTGLGHPEEIIRTLTGEYYDTVLDLRATLTLVDPRKLSDSRYTENATFQDQIAVADILVANKADLCSDADRERFDQLTTQHNTALHQWVEYGQLCISWLDHSRKKREVAHPHLHQKFSLNAERAIFSAQATIPENQSFIRRSNEGQGFYSCGWLFRASVIFDFNALFLWLSGLAFVRVKAVMITSQGGFSFNAESGVLSVNQVDNSLAQDLPDSRIEIIDDKAIAADILEQQLLSAQSS